MTERKQLPVEFELTNEQNAELELLVNALIDKCKEFEAPVMVAICVQNDGKKWAAAEANYFNGERTPTAIAIANSIVEQNIAHPMQLLALMAGK